MTESSAELQSRLRWRCRRGMQELDILLGGWLENRWPEAGPELRQDFECLLQCEDDRIWSWVMEREPPDPGLAVIIGEIREQAGRPASR